MERSGGKRVGEWWWWIGRERERVCGCGKEEGKRLQVRLREKKLRRLGSLARPAAQCPQPTFTHLRCAANHK